MTEFASPAPTQRTATSRTRTVTGHGPTALGLGLSRGVFEIKALWNSKAQLAVTIAMPFFFMVLLNEVFNNDSRAGQERLAASIIAVAIMSTALQGIALSVGVERTEGGLLRLRGMPMPKSSYFIGKIIMVLATTIVQITLALGLGHVLYHVAVPTSASHWMTFAWVYLLGVISCTLLGLAISNLVDGDNGGSIVILPFVGLQMVSGVFIAFSSLSSSVQHIAAVFPLKWMTQGIQAAFLPDSFLADQPAGTWELGRTALVLGAWTIGALVLCLKTFRWRSSGEG